MARRLDVVNRGKPFSDEGCCYQWSWHWLDADFVVFDDDGNERSSADMVNSTENLLQLARRIARCAFTLPIYLSPSMVFASWPSSSH